MNYYNQGLLHLKKLGLNIFLSAKVSDIPSEIYSFTEDQKKKTLCLIGNGGKEFWENVDDFNISHPLDTFSKKQMIWFAQNILKSEIEILFPNDDLVMPLQKIGRHLNLSKQSPLGIDISHEFGLWFSFRGVFLTESSIPITNSIDGEKIPFPCDTCHDKPCLSVTEFSEARMKCPIKREHVYTLEQRTYHAKQLTK